MNNQAQHAYFTPEEYLELERQSPFKHEYQRGLVYAMASYSKKHIQITGNLYRLLGNHLNDSPCLMYGTTLKVRIEMANCYYYPDVSVTCDKRDDEEDSYFILYPQLIVEVLSKKTENFDRTDKFKDYQQLPSLEEYILVSQDKVEVECHRKQASGEWISQCYSAGDTVEIKSVDFQCPIEEIYRKVLGVVG